MNTKRNFWLDVILLVAFAVAIVSGLAMWLFAAINPAVVHAWAHIHGLSVVVITIVVIAHLVSHRQWIAAAFKPGRKNRQVSLNRALDMALLVLFILVTVSGLSSHGGRQVVELDPFHLLVGLAMAGIVAAHQALHWKWIVSTTRRFLGFNTPGGQSLEPTSINQTPLN